MLAPKPMCNLPSFDSGEIARAYGVRDDCIRGPLGPITAENAEPVPVPEGGDHFGFLDIDDPRAARIREKHDVRTHAPREEDVVIPDFEQVPTPIAKLHRESEPPRAVTRI